MTNSQEAQQIYNYQQKQKAEIVKYCKNFCKDCKLKELECDVERYVPNKYLAGIYCKKKDEVRDGSK